MANKTDFHPPFPLSIDAAIPWRVRGPNGERIADFSSSLTAGAMLNIYNAAHEMHEALRHIGHDLAINPGGILSHEAIEKARKYFP